MLSFNVHNFALKMNGQKMILQFNKLILITILQDRNIVNIYKYLIAILQDRNIINIYKYLTMQLQEMIIIL